MSAERPVFQILDRQDSAVYAAALWVAPPEGGDVAPGAAVWTADHAIATHYRERGVMVFEGLEAPEYGFDRALLFWPKAQALGRWWLQTLCTVLKDGATLDVVGEHQVGIKRMPKLMEELGLAGERVDNARRCSIFSMAVAPVPAPDSFSRFEALGLTLVSHPGVFGHGKLDDGTALLLENLPELKGEVLDVGCGDGIIAAFAAKQGVNVTACDVSHFAVEATKQTLAANEVEGRVVASDMLESVEGRFHAIITNPPFHEERDVTLMPTRRLIEQAAGMLKMKSAFYLVANSFLPYQEALSRTFNSVEVIADNRRFKVYECRYPKRR
ncbi:class I SAM-dependent methyltransferase [Larsenimonas rhizosphaerae]|uniref:class I SAM-dependent methyltransferase n=1 Tax=Larsenimonas rhizosphaerae TaxID=2944682 RepID=UPI002033692C|nr:class I SAM-dependent methyltransferase [Larsenimonas rhizosphaerae]MCM2131973.1 class I SAM-dependent methyltransferase [Larsenimonas rhizosphaerae]